MWNWGFEGFLLVPFLVIYFSCSRSYGEIREDDVEEVRVEWKLYFNAEQQFRRTLAGLRQKREYLLCENYIQHFHMLFSCNWACIDDATIGFRNRRGIAGLSEIHNRGLPFHRLR
jgi:hypothetical protein